MPLDLDQYETGKQIATDLKDLVDGMFRVGDWDLGFQFVNNSDLPMHFAGWCADSGLDIHQVGKLGGPPLPGDVAPGPITKGMATQAEFYVKVQSGLSMIVAAVVYDHGVSPAQPWTLYVWGQNWGGSQYAYNMEFCKGTPADEHAMWEQIYTLWAGRKKANEGKKSISLGRFHVQAYMDTGSATKTETAVPTVVVGFTEGS